MRRMFEPGYVYPSDHTGPFNEISGRVVEVNPSSDDPGGPIQVAVRTEYGVLYGWYEGEDPPRIGYRATIRCYVAGGGWYPDDIIVGWRKA